MRNAIKIVAAIPMGLFCALGCAQEEQQETETYIYSTYFVCDVTQQEAVDALVEAETAPIYEAAMADGSISGWGWLAHHTGGKWRRVLYSTANSMDGLFAAQTAIQEASADLDPDNLFGSACNAHDDYVWKTESGNVFDGPRGPVGFSVYFICDQATEERADEIVESALADIYNAHVGDGMLTSWGWSSHQIGGKYRRLNTMTAANISDLLKARNSVIEAMFGDDGPAAAAEFNEICNDHSDYIWDIQIESP